MKFRKKPVVIEAMQFETNNVGGNEHISSWPWLNSPTAISQARSQSTLAR